MLGSCLFLHPIDRTIGLYVRPPTHLKVAKASLKLHLGTIPGRVGWGGKHVVIMLSQFNRNFNCLLELSLAIVSKKFKGYFIGVSRLFKGYFKGVSRQFHGSQVSGKFQGCYRMNFFRDI